LFLLFLFPLTSAALPLADWKATAPGNFSSLTKDEVDLVITPILESGTYEGVVVSLVDPNGSVTYSYGYADAEKKKKVDNRTLFSIGSISKTFTGVLLADAQNRGELNLTTPIAQYVPVNYSIPSLNGREITLEDIATHTSGLPGVPDLLKDVDPNLSPGDQVEQAFMYYGTFPAETAYGFVQNYTLPREPGAAWEYSNLGASIAGDIAALRAGTSYEDLLKRRILSPLGMDETRINLSGAEGSLANGYRAYADPRDKAKLLQFNDFWTASGGIYSTGEDMATFLAAELDIIETPLNAAFPLTHQIRALRSEGPPMIEQGLFLDTSEGADGTRIYLKPGETNGFQAIIGFISDDKEGVVILANTAYLNETHIQSEAVALLQMMHGKAFA
ncbi:MAG: serine hydrolase domain-containing protein, partial [Methanobacteriota archaeon]